AEDGIRDKLVTGVQTCALPISSRSLIFVINTLPHLESLGLGRIVTQRIKRLDNRNHLRCVLHPQRTLTTVMLEKDMSGYFSLLRSEERRVGKECRSQWWT